MQTNKAPSSKIDNRFIYFVILILFVALTSFVNAAFIPLSLEEKVKRSHVIVIAKVKKITELPKNEERKLFDPTQKATLKSLKVYHRFKGVDIPRSFNINFGSGVIESPTLTKGRKYFMFLRHVKGDLYKPVGRASMHPIYSWAVFKSRVLTFGMDNPKNMSGKDFEERSESLSPWVRKVSQLWNVNDLAID